jgi:hypothetical protein
MPEWLIYALWGAVSVFVVWVALAKMFLQYRDRRSIARQTAEKLRLMAQGYPEIAQQ